MDGHLPCLYGCRDRSRSPALRLTHCSDAPAARLIRYLAALTDVTQAEIVDRAVTEYAARHSDEITGAMERARAVLSSGDAAIAAYLLDGPIEAVGRVADRSPASL